MDNSVITAYFDGDKECAKFLRYSFRDEQLGRVDVCRYSVEPADRELGVFARIIAAESCTLAVRVPVSCCP